MVRQIRRLPDQLFSEVVCRMQNGETISAIARWLGTQDRGVLSGVTAASLNIYLIELRKDLNIEKIRREKRNGAIRTIAQYVREEQQGHANVVAIRKAQDAANTIVATQMPEVQSLSSLEADIKATCRGVSEVTRVNKYLWYILMKRYERFMGLEDKLPVPVAALNELFQSMIKASDTATRARRVDLMAQKQAGGFGGLTMVIEGSELKEVDGTGVSSSSVPTPPKPENVLAKQRANLTFGKP